MRVKYADLRPGDVFGFHVGDGQYAFARLLFSVKGFGHVCEVFDYRSGKLIFDDKILHSGRLMPLQDVNLYSTIRPSVWRWKVIHRDSAFVAPLDEIRNLEFSAGISQAMRYNVDWTPGSEEMRRFVRDATPEERQAMESGDDTANTERLYIRIRKLWNLCPNEWESAAAMWEWFYQNKVFFRPLSR